MLNEKQVALLKKHQMSRELIAKFPFSAYQIIGSGGQGNFYIDTLDYIKYFLDIRQTWELEIVELIYKYAKPHTIVVDVGAHIGIHTMTMSRCVQENGLVIAFEPQEKIHRELVHNLKLNQCDNVIPVHAALGAENSIGYLGPFCAHNEGHRSISSKQPTEKISILKLDDFHLSPVSLIKIDTESYELEVLQGAFETILRNKPVIIIEIGGSSAREEEEGIDLQKQADEVLQLLEKTLHYEVRVISAAAKNYLAIPRLFFGLMSRDGVFSD